MLLLLLRSLGPRRWCATHFRLYSQAPTRLCDGSGGGGGGWWSGGCSLSYCTWPIFTLYRDCAIAVLPPPPSLLHSTAVCPVQLSSTAISGCVSHTPNRAEVVCAVCVCVVEWSYLCSSRLGPDRPKIDKAAIW